MVKKTKSKKAKNKKKAKSKRKIPISKSTIIERDTEDLQSLRDKSYQIPSPARDSLDVMIEEEGLHMEAKKRVPSPQLISTLCDELSRFSRRLPPTCAEIRDKVVNGDEREERPSTFELLRYIKCLSQQLHRDLIEFKR